MSNPNPNTNTNTNPNTNTNMILNSKFITNLFLIYNQIQNIEYGFV